MKNIKYAIEGILFAAGEPVKAAKLAVVLDCSLGRSRRRLRSLRRNTTVTSGDLT